MIFGLPFGEIAGLALALVAGGLLTGFLAGLLGIGGGGVIVPVLYELFRIEGVDDSVRMQICVATSLAIIIPTSIRSALSHFERGAVDLGVIRKLGPWIVLGAAFGVLIASASPSAVLKGVFVVSTLFMATRLAIGSQPKAEGVEKLPQRPWNGLAGASIGLISTLIGIGGGAYITAYMRLFGWPIHRAVGTASGFGPVIAIPATVGYVIEGWGSPLLPPLSFGFVSLLGVAIVAPVSVLAAPAGVKIAHGLPKRALELIFMGFLLLVATRFIVSLAFGI